ncbi:TonB-dependent receptor [Microbulbifer magnicolonia]|uniref:TonB-dependent receptor n=1 Tax=Microbulbifer magnicolonia TaxID=3109744 RepID=UPI002B401453|nr:TonB-dependent receptor [Microbulbifer sp. GG15]
MTGNDINELDGDAYRAQLLYDADGDFTASLSLDGMDSERLSYTGDAVTDSFGVVPETASPGANQVSMTIDPLEERSIRGSALTMDWDLASGYAVKSISAARDTEIFYGNDTDYAAWDLVRLAYQDSYTQLSQELQLISPDADAFIYVAGLYLYQQQGDSLRQLSSSALAAQLFGTDPALPTTTDGTVDTGSYATFVNGSYALSERWKLGFGFRYSREDKQVDWRIDGRGSGAFGTAIGSVQDERSDNHFSPTANLSYAFSPDVNGYVKYSGGYKSGGFNLDFVSDNDLAAGIEFDKETVDAYEAGLKGTLWQRRLGFSLAVFRADYSDYQVNQFVDLGGGRTAISIRNAAEVETRGLEAEFTYRPTDNLTLNAAFGLLDAEFAEYPGGGAGGSDVSGNKLPGVSDYSVNLGVQYYHPLPSLGAELLARLDYSYRDDYYNSADNEQSRTLLTGESVQYGWVDGVGLVNARLGLQSDGESWTAALWVRNLTDEDYLTQTSRDFFGTLTHFAGTPRTYGIDLGYRF